MKIKTIFVCILLSLLLTSPALAREKTPSGDQINIANSGTQTFVANTPFYIQHGWKEIEPKAINPGQVIFQLEMDGVFVKPTYVEYSTTVTEYGPFIDKDWFYNFPEGLSGTHTFEGHWIGPCWVALYYELVSECANPMADYDWHYSEVVIEFN